MSIKLAVVGLGMMGRNHARVARTIEGMELVAVADPMGDPHHSAGELPLFTNIEELIDSGIDAAIVAVPTKFHLDVGLAFAEAGVHALIEKPIADSIASGEALLDAFDSRGLVGAVGHIERFNPALVSLRHRLENGDLGEIYQIHTRRQGPFPARITDIGVIKDLASHDVDLTAWLAQSTYSQISAHTAHKSHPDHEDMVTITAKFSNGIIASHIVNRLTPFKERVTIVTGERGAFLADTLTGDLTFYENGTSAGKWDAVSAFRGVSEGTITRFALNKVEPLRAELDAFRDRILGLPSDLVSLREGLEVLRICEASIDSAITGTTIQLGPQNG